MSAAPLPIRRPRSPDALTNLVLLCVLAAVVLVTSIFVPYYLSLSNLLDATRSGGEVGLIGLGMATVMLVGGIDLSVGAVFALSAIVMGILISVGAPVWLAAAACLATGTVAGSLNGLVITRLGIPPIVVTLASMAVFRGLTIGLSKGQSYPVPESFYFIGQGSVAGVPAQIVLLLAIAAGLAFLLRRTAFGLTLHAVGHSERAARYAALRVDRRKVAVYALSGLLAALASIVYVSRVVSAKADFGTGYELDAITIAVLGGTALSGGRANVAGTVIAMLIVVLLRRGLTMAFVQTDFQSVFIGLILIGSVALNRALRSRALEWLRALRKARGAAPLEE